MQLLRRLGPPDARFHRIRSFAARIVEIRAMLFGDSRQIEK
jgi:hypothetical protein